MDYAVKLGRHNIVSIYMEFLLTTATDLSLVYKEFFEFQWSLLKYHFEKALKKCFIRV